MNASLALHTAARRYCLERHAYWCERYSEIVRKREDRQRDGYHYTPEALATFPRYNVLNAIAALLPRHRRGKSSKRGSEPPPEYGAEDAANVRQSVELSV